MSGETTRYEAEFKKTPGILTLTETHIAWNAKEPGAMDRQSQALQRATNMLASKADSKKVSLKILFKDDIPVGGLLFTFTAATAREDRQKVQDTLIPFVSANRAGVAAPNAGGAMTGPSTPGGIGSPAGTGTAAPTPGPSTPAGPSSVVGKGKRKAEEGPGRETNGKAAKPINFDLRKKVLNKNPTLKMLHRELVLGKQITEEEFWEGREALLHAEEMAQAQKPGRASGLPDDRFDLDSGRKTAKGQGGTGVGIKKQDTGPTVVTLTKDRIRDLFEAFPVLQDAYARHVPGISEVEFWQRYFSSQLCEQHRASARKSANDEPKKDDIFDQYLEEPDWNIAPRRALDGDVESYLNLAATQEDHGGGEADVVRDFTMQAGRERSSLPLIRRFNEHSNRLLRKGDKSKTAEGDDDEIVLDDRNIYQEIDLEDLHGPAAPAFIALDVQDAANNVNGEKDGSTAKGVMPGRPDEELMNLAAREAQALQAWHLDFSQTSMAPPVTQAEKEAGLSPEQKKAAEAYSAQREGQAVAMYVVKEIHNASNAENATSRPLPHHVMEQMRSCHNAATEFLRQYWSAVLPTPAGALGAGTASSSAGAKAAKAAKMAGYLRGTAGKVEAVVHIATEAGVEPGRIRAALAPTIGAVDLALRREQRRLAAS